MEDIRARLKDEVGQETFSSLEEIFVQVVSEGGNPGVEKRLSWL